MTRTLLRRVRALERTREDQPVEVIDFADYLDLSPREKVQFYLRHVRGEVRLLGGPELPPFLRGSTEASGAEAVEAYRAWSDEVRRTWPQRLAAYKRSIGKD